MGKNGEEYSVNPGRYYLCASVSNMISLFTRPMCEPSCAEAGDVLFTSLRRERSPPDNLRPPSPSPLPVEGTSGKDVMVHAILGFHGWV